jgi:drug/metabolite transporter (DMT)-like permease
LWQSITVTLLSLPMALMDWQWPSLLQWGVFLVCGAMGSGGHYCLTRSYVSADISATQSIRFLELVWAAAIGWLFFADPLSQWTVVGGLVICASTVWIARHEARTRA